MKRIGAVCEQLRPDASLTDRATILRTMNDVIVGLLSCGMCHVFMGWANALLNEDPDHPREVQPIYQARRDALCDGLNRIGWEITPPGGTMFAWARIPEP